MPYRESAESEIREYLIAHHAEFQDNTASHDLQDFVIRFNRVDTGLYLDVKEKDRRINVQNWPPVAPEEHLFILDDLSARKCIAWGLYSTILVRDNEREKYFLFSSADLALMPKVRVNREIHMQVRGFKGKWLIDLRNGREFDTLDGVFRALVEYCLTTTSEIMKSLPCFGTYIGERIGVGGEVRRVDHRIEDVTKARG